MVETDLKTKLCRHGETSSTIRNWLQIEANARAEDKEPPSRPSACDCTNTHGLQNHTATRPPTPPVSVYDVLAANEAKQMDVGEEAPALQLGDRDAYLAASGAVFCVHKERLMPMTKAVRPYVFKARHGKCECALIRSLVARPRSGWGVFCLGKTVITLNKQMHITRPRDMDPTTGRN